MNNINSKTPSEFTGLKLAKPYDESVGITAITTSLNHVFRAMPFGRAIKTLFKLNQKHGIDCPSCAWPDSPHRSPIAAYCESGAKAIAEEATTLKVTPVFFQRYSVEELSNKSDYWLGQQGRLTSPMIVREGQTHYEKISWNEAFQYIGKTLKNLPSPNEAIFYTSGRTSNEASFLYQIFAKMYGTNNMPDCSNMCHESSGCALSNTLGLGKGSATLNDLEKAEVIIIMGLNPGTNAPRMLITLEKAKRNGAKIISINPLIEAGLLAFKNPQDVRDMVMGATTLTDIYLQVNLNQDLVLIKCIMKLLLEADKLSNGQVFDHSFIKANTEGFMELIENMNGYSVEQLVSQSGVELSKLQEVANLLAVNNKIVICWSMGMTQHKNSVISIQEIVNLLLLKGSVGREGAGTFPVRGHSNVQGNRSVGIYEKPSQKLLDSVEKIFGFKPPQEHGFGTVEAIKAMYENKAKVFFGMGGNFLSATPDTDYTSKAMTNCDLTVHVSTKLNRSHLVHGKVGIILPTLGRTDEDMQASGPQSVTVENSIGFVHNSKGILEPPSATLLSEIAIVAELAKSTLDANKYQVDWDNLTANYDNIRDLMEQTLEGFDNYNARVLNNDGFFLPNAPREGKFTTKSQKAHFTINAPTSNNLADNEYLMMTIRSHDQFNTTIYGLNDRYRGIYNERRVIMMNEKDIADANLSIYQVVNLHNYYGGVHRQVQRFIVIPYKIPIKNVATYFPETNALVPIDSVADTSLTPTSKSVVITIEPVLEYGKILIAEVMD